MAGEDVEVTLFDGVPRSQVVLEGAVDEVHDVVGRTAQHPAAQQEGPQDRRRVPLPGRRRQRGQRALHDPLGRLQGHLGPAAQHQGVGDALEQFELGRFAQLRSFGRAHAALPVAPGEQHGEGGVVQFLAPGGQVAAALAVQGADQAAHERVGGEAGQVPLGAQGVQKPLLVLRGVRRLVPAVDEGGDLRPAHGCQGQFPEALLGQPVGAYGGGSGGHQPAVAGVGVDEGAQPVAGAVAVGFRDLVQTVDQDQRPARGQHAFRPAVRRGQRTADGAQEGGRCGQRAGADKGAQREGVRDVGALACRGHCQPLHQCRLPGAGVAAQQHPGVLVQRLVGGHPSGAGRRILAGGGGPVGFPVGGRLQRQVGDLQGPAVRGVAQVDAVDGDVVVAVGDVGQVAALEGGVPAVRAGRAGDQLVDLGDQFRLGPGLFDEGAGDERGAAGEELQDVQARPLGRVVQEVAGVRGQTVGSGARPAQSRGQLAVAEAHRLDIVHVEVAEGEQPAGQAVGDGDPLVGREGRLAGGVHRLCHDPPGELVDVPLLQGALLAPEGHESGQAYGLVDQARARSVRTEELLQQRSDQRGRQLAAEYRRIQPPHPRDRANGGETTGSCGRVRRADRRSPAACTSSRRGRPRGRWRCCRCSR